MNTGNSGAVFFLGTRAHYQVLNQPDRPFDVENGNSSQNSTTSTLWPDTDSQNNDVRNWCSESPEVIGNDDKDTGVKRRAKRRPSETALCDDMRPAQLNGNNDSGTPKSKNRRVNLFNALASLARRKRRLQSHNACYLRTLETALTTCTYRDSCRCLDCQGAENLKYDMHKVKHPIFDKAPMSEIKKVYSLSLRMTFHKFGRFVQNGVMICFDRGRSPTKSSFISEITKESRYFECDEDEDSSEDEEYEYYAALYASQVVNKCQHDDDDEVFVDTVPGDDASTDMLLDVEEKEKSVSSDNTSENTEDNAHIELEVAAGTPIVLNYLLTHPFHCTIQ